jgi:hypothetical protein
MDTTAFLAALGSRSAAPDRAEAMQLYGRLAGSWEIETVHHRDDGAVENSTGEVHFGWILEGRAIQDVWIRPRRPATPTMYGTTLRVYDPAIDAWHIIWCDPLNGDHARQIGRAEGDDIVQIGSDSRGIGTRWRFTAITPVSFRWIGEERAADDLPWRVTWEHSARRIAAV